MYYAGSSEIEMKLFPDRLVETELFDNIWNKWGYINGRKNEISNIGKNGI